MSLPSNWIFTSVDLDKERIVAPAGTAFVRYNWSITRKRTQDGSYTSSAGSQAGSVTGYLGTISQSFSPPSGLLYCDSDSASTQAIGGDWYVRTQTWTYITEWTAE